MNHQHRYNVFYTNMTKITLFHITKLNRCIRMKTLEVLRAATSDVDTRETVVEEPVEEVVAPVVEEPEIEEVPVVAPAKSEPAEDLSETRVIEGTRAQRFAAMAVEEEEEERPAPRVPSRANRSFTNLIEDDDDDEDDDDKVSGLFENKKSKLFGKKKNPLAIFGKKKNTDDDDDDYDDDDYDDDDYEDDDE